MISAAAQKELCLPDPHEIKTRSSSVASQVSLLPPSSSMLQPISKAAINMAKAGCWAAQEGGKGHAAHMEYHQHKLTSLVGCMLWSSTHLLNSMTFLYQWGQLQVNHVKDCTH